MGEFQSQRNLPRTHPQPAPVRERNARDRIAIRDAGWTPPPIQSLVLLLNGPPVAARREGQGGSVMRWPGQRRRRWQLRPEAASRRVCAAAPTALASVAIRRRRIEFNPRLQLTGASAPQPPLGIFGWAGRRRLRQAPAAETHLVRPTIR